MDACQRSVFTQAKFSIFMYSGHVMTSTGQILHILECQFLCWLLHDAHDSSIFHPFSTTVHFFIKKIMTHITK